MGEMTRAEKLKWLVQELKEWKGGYEFCVVNVGHEDIYITWPINCSPSSSSFTKAEWKAAREALMKTPEPASSWYERGEFPPIGTICEMIDDKETWLECEIIAHKNSFCIGWISSRNAPFYTDDKSEFRPLRTEREKAIEDMSRIMHEHDSVINDITLGALYDAGYRKERAK